MGLNDDLWNYIKSGCASLTKVKEYIKEGADVNYKKWTAIELSCIMVACDALSSYIKNNNTNIYSNLNIYTSNLYEYFLIIKFLLERRADANTKTRSRFDCDRVCALAIVISSICRDIARRMRNNTEYIKPDLLSYVDNTDKRYFNIIKLLLEYGADPDYIDSRFLYEYARSGWYDIVNDVSLKVIGAINDMKKNMKNGVEVINIVKQGNLEKFREYTRQGCIVYSDSSDKSTLMYACETGNFEMALTLISAGADINAKDINGKTVLNYAAESGNTKLMELLLAQGADNGTKK